jgi:nucleotide-binding universal stress UspA family protein
MQPLVIAYEGSDLGQATVRAAAELFPGRRALVVTVWEPGMAAMMTTNLGMGAFGETAVAPDLELATELNQAEENHAAVVAREGARLAGSLGLKPEPHPVADEARVADAIVGIAEERDAAALIVGSRGAHGLRSRMLGSTSADVLARCTRPVLVVRASAAAPDAER